MSGQIVITGAAGGIGAALADHFLSRGRAVAGIDIAPFSDRTAAMPDFVGIRSDITDEAALERAFDAIAARGPISTVIANAAVTDLAHSDTLSMLYATWSRVLRINVDGAFLTGRAAARRMGRGNIVFVTSSLAMLSQAKANDAAYCTSKAAVEMLARVMALELAPMGINVNTLYPSAVIDTGFFAHWSAEQRRVLAPPTILNGAASALADLPPGAVTGRSLDHARWENERAYRCEWGAA